jgi:integrator complex subunit 11
MVLLATPGMLHGGSSVQVFKEWCTNENNTLIIPGYCVAGTLGNKLLTGTRQLVIDKKNYDVKMRIANISFSAHADAKGILNLMRHLEP